MSEKKKEVVSLYYESAISRELVFVGSLAITEPEPAVIVFKEKVYEFLNYADSGPEYVKMDDVYFAPDNAEFTPAGVK